MGTWDSSRICQSRSPKGCVECKNTIPAGYRYLRYKLGLRNDVTVCLRCALDTPLYDCAALREERAARDEPNPDEETTCR